MSNQIDLQKYQKFVTAVTSRESMNFDDLLRRINELRNTTNVNISLLMTAGIGLSSEGGEFNEIVKKMVNAFEARAGRLYRTLSWLERTENQKTRL